MSKTYLMGDGKLTDEEREVLKNTPAEGHVSTHANFKAKERVSIEALLKTPIEPEEDRVLVFPDPVEEFTGGGLLKPKEAIDAERPMIGTVIAVGPGKHTQQDMTNQILMHIVEFGTNIIKTAWADLQKEVKKSQEIPLKPGDRILFGRFAGTKVEDPATKAEVLIMRPADIFAKIRA